MTIFNNLHIFNKRVVAIDDNLKTYKYKDLLDNSLKIKKLTKPRDNVFLICENSFSFLYIYVGLVRNRNIIYLIDRSIKKDKFEVLQKLHKPKFILYPIEFSEKIENYNCQKVDHNYSIVKTNFHLKLNFQKDISILLSTSGSTGSPKFVKLSFLNIKDNTKKISNYLNIKKKDRAVTTMECSYSYGMSIINTHLYSGASIFLTKKNFFDKNFWTLMNKIKVTNFGGVPFAFEILNKIKFYEKKLPNLKTVTQAGGKLNNEIMLKFIKLFRAKKIKFYIMYGQTEASPRMSYLDFKFCEKKIGSIGKPLIGGKFKIYDDNKKIINQVNKIGELVYQGKNIMLGYANNIHDLTKSKKIKNLFTGDLAYIDKDGFYFITGRKNRVIKINGLRYSLDEIEKELNQEGFICVVQGLEDKLIIFLTKKINYLKTHISNFLFKSYKIRRDKIIFKEIKKIPRNIYGKITYSSLTN
jgi:long-chain acyl-CoA synthetase